MRVMRVVAERSNEVFRARFDSWNKNKVGGKSDGGFFLLLLCCKLCLFCLRCCLSLRCVFTDNSLRTTMPWFVCSRYRFEKSNHLAVCSLVLLVVCLVCPIRKK